ncbi:MAG: hypothetical protein AAFO03_20870 [Bacteroidota bacterium]
MLIQANDSILQVQERFQALFPLLQLRFYRVGHQVGETSSHRDEIVNTERTLKSLSPNLQSCEVPANPETTVGELELEFAQLAGLHVQIFRKAGKEWIQTTNTDKWTLQRQQEIAAETAYFFQNIRR